MPVRKRKSARELKKPTDYPEPLKVRFNAAEDAYIRGLCAGAGIPIGVVMREATLRHGEEIVRAIQNGEVTPRSGSRMRVAGAETPAALPGAIPEQARAQQREHDKFMGDFKPTPLLELVAELSMKPVVLVERWILTGKVTVGGEVVRNPKFVVQRGISIDYPLV